jgi:hypothetical protein
MTDDQISRGLLKVGRQNGQPFEPVAAPDKVEALLATRPTGPDGATELWKIAHYFDRLAEWEEEHGVTPPVPDPAVDHDWELYNLTDDPEERTNLARDERSAAVLDDLHTLLRDARATKRLTPRHRNP